MDNNSWQDQSIAYLVTIRCYGTWLHGDSAEYATGLHNGYGTPFIPPNPRRMRKARERMRELPYALDKTRRELAFDGIVNKCADEDWELYAARIRSQHGHIVAVSSQIEGDIVLSKSAVDPHRAGRPRHVITPRPAFSWSGGTRCGLDQRRSSRIQYASGASATPDTPQPPSADLGYWRKKPGVQNVSMKLRHRAKNAPEPRNALCIRSGLRFRDDSGRL